MHILTLYIFHRMNVMQHQVLNVEILLAGCVEPLLMKLCLHHKAKLKRSMLTNILNTSTDF